MQRQGLNGVGVRRRRGGQGDGGGVALETASVGISLLASSGDVLAAAATPGCGVAA